MNIGERFNPHKSFLGLFIPEPICKYRGLSLGAKLVYGRLYRYAGANGDVYPAAATLAEEVGICERQAREYIQELERGRFIEVDRENKHYRKDGSGGTNTYFFLWHSAFEGDRGVPRNTPPPRQSTAGVPLQSAAALTPAVDCRQRESISLRESVKESQAKADSPAAPRKTSEANPVSQLAPALNTKTKHKPPKADPPAENAGEETPFSVENQKTGADQNSSAVADATRAPSFPPWTDRDASEIRKLLSAFMEGEEPPLKLMDWICSTFGGVCPARDVCAALEAAWNRSAAPGKKNAPRTWNWFYSTLRNALIPGESARLPERPAAPHPDHAAGPATIRSGIEAIELANAPRSLVESVVCNECGSFALARYTNGTIESCGCRQKRGEGLNRIPASTVGALLESAGSCRRSA